MWAVNMLSVRALPRIKLLHEMPSPMALARASSLAWYSSSVFGANGLGGLNKFSRFHVPIRMAMTHNSSAQALIDLAVHPRRVTGLRYAAKSRAIHQPVAVGVRLVRTT